MFNNIDHAINSEKMKETSIKTFWKNESNVGLRSQKGWKQGRVVVTVHIAPWTHDYSITSSLHTLQRLSRSLNTTVCCNVGCNAVVMYP